MALYDSNSYSLMTSVLRRGMIKIRSRPHLTRPIISMSPTCHQSGHLIIIMRSTQLARHLMLVAARSLHNKTSSSLARCTAYTRQCCPQSAQRLVAFGESVFGFPVQTQKTVLFGSDAFVAEETEDYGTLAGCLFVWSCAVPETSLEDESCTCGRFGGDGAILEIGVRSFVTLVKEHESYDGKHVPRPDIGVVGARKDSSSSILLRNVTQ